MMKASRVPVKAEADVRRSDKDKPATSTRSNEASNAWLCSSCLRVLVARKTAPQSGVPVRRLAAARFIKRRINKRDTCARTRRRARGSE
jgi:hypothetical protein